MTDSGVTTSERRQRRIAVVLGVGALCALAIFLGTDGHIAGPERATQSRKALTTVAPDESKRGVRKSAAPRLNERIDTSAPLPEPGTRLAPIYAELKARANAGDAAAASRLYRDLHRCLSAARELHTANLPDTEPEDIPETLAPELRAKALASLEQERSSRAERLRKARQDIALCDGLDREQQFVLPAMRRAAELGDADAAACYVTGHDLWRQGALDHPEWMAEYKSNALTIAQNALERGNLLVALMLANAYSADRNVSPVLERLTGIDPVESYRYSKLASLALPDHGASDSRLAAAARALPAEARAAADAWAQDMFARHFGAYVSRSTALCEPDMTEELNAQLRARPSAAKN